MNFKFLYIIVIVLFSHFNINAQEKANSQWNLRFGYSRINHQWCNLGEFTVEGNYRVNKLIEAGVYAGYSETMQKKVLYDEYGFINGTRYIDASVLSYGINSYFHLSSLFLKDNSRLGIRVIARPGCFFVFADEGATPQGHYFTFRPGLGIDFRPFRKMGIFGEYVYGFGDGTYRACKDDNGWGTDNKKHIGSFRFGINILL